MKMTLLNIGLLEEYVSYVISTTSIKGEKNLIADNKITCFLEKN